MTVYVELKFAWSLKGSSFPGTRTYTGSSSSIGVDVGVGVVVNGTGENVGA
jgi:hypothetical protein